MMKNFRKTLKNKRGQIGQILVVLVLIILAVLGIIKYVMPMFNQGGQLSQQTQNNLSGLSTSVASTTVGYEGEIVTGSAVIDTINAFKTDMELTVTVNGKTYGPNEGSGFNTGYLYLSPGDDTGYVDPSATYKKALTKTNGTVTNITFTKLS